MLDARARGAARAARRRARERFERELGLSADSARLLAWRAELGDFFEAALARRRRREPQPLANWVPTSSSRASATSDPAASQVAPAALAHARRRWSRAKAVTQGAAKQVLDTLVAEGGDPRAIVEAEGLGAIGGGDELEPDRRSAALDANPDAAEKLRGGNMKPIGAIVGHVMRETKGRADGGEVTRLVREKLGL